MFLTGETTKKCPQVSLPELKLNFCGNFVIITPSVPPLTNENPKKTMFRLKSIINFLAVIYLSIFQ